MATKFPHRRRTIPTDGGHIKLGGHTSHWERTHHTGSGPIPQGVHTSHWERTLHTDDGQFTLMADTSHFWRTFPTDFRLTAETLHRRKLNITLGPTHHTEGTQFTQTDIHFTLTSRRRREFFAGAGHITPAAPLLQGVEFVDKFVCLDVCRSKSEHFA